MQLWDRPCRKAAHVTKICRQSLGRGGTGTSPLPSCHAVSRSRSESSANTQRRQPGCAPRHQSGCRARASTRQAKGSDGRPCSSHCAGASPGGDAVGSLCGRIRRICRPASRHATRIEAWRLAQTAASGRRATVSATLGNRSGDGLTQEGTMR